MTRRFFGFLGALTGLALVSGSCVDDPLADLDASPAAIEASHSILQLTEGGASFPITASVVDGRSTPLEIPVTATACDAAVTATADATYDPVPATSARFRIAGISPAASCVNLAGGGLTKRVDAVVLPVFFGGTPSATSLQPGQTLTLASTATLRFDAATSNINFGGGNLGVVTNRTATSLSVQVPIPAVAQPARLTVQNVDVTYVPGLRVNLPTQAQFTMTNPHDPNDAPGPATTATVPDTLFEGFLAGDVDNFYTLTLAGTTTFTVTLDWAASYGADLDILFCNAACSAFVGNFDGASTANPEVSTVTLPAGTYNLWINNFVSSGSTPAAPLYRIRITP